MCFFMCILYTRVAFLNIGIIASFVVIAEDTCMRTGSYLFRGLIFLMGGLKFLRRKKHENTILKSQYVQCSTLYNFAFTT